MKYVGLTLRVDPLEKERRDAIDQRWYKFLNACGLIPILIPNHLETASSVLNAVNLAGIIFSGGNTLSAVGGDAPERDALEYKILDMASTLNMSILGVCRGMQIILQNYGSNLMPVKDHIDCKHLISWEGHKRLVNSYHAFGSFEVNDSLAVIAKAEDGVIEAIHHSVLPIKGIMWHPEREISYDPEDISLFKEHFSK